MIIPIATFFLMYFAFLLIVIIGWKKKPTLARNLSYLKISVIIPVRNEERNLRALLERLLTQNYPHFEIIVVDDHSTDSTSSIVADFDLLQVKLIQNSGEGKKTAIATGISVAKGDLIVTTDGDCLPGSEWLQTINAYFVDSTQMVAGPVRLSGHGFFARLQQIEFASLIGSTAAMIQLGKPVMCNGANLAYRRDTFLQVKGFDGNDHLPSGDDEFLMRKIETQYPGSIVFAHEQHAIVSTSAAPSLDSFLNQRLRWASKWRWNSSFTAAGVAAFIAAFQIIVLATVCYSVLGNKIVITLLLIKLLFELYLLKKFCRFLQMPWNWLAFLVLQVTYPVYVLFVGFTSIIRGYQWKGRKYGD